MCPPLLLIKQEGPALFGWGAAGGPPPAPPLSAAAAVGRRGHPPPGLFSRRRGFQSEGGEYPRAGDLVDDLLQPCSGSMRGIAAQRLGQGRNVDFAREVVPLDDEEDEVWRWERDSDDGRGRSEERPHGELES